MWIAVAETTCRDGLETIWTFIVVNAIVARWWTSVSAFAFTLERTISIGTSGVGITIVCTNSALINIDANGAKVTGIGMFVAAIVEFSHSGSPWLKAGVTGTSVTARAVPIVVVARGMCMTTVTPVLALVHITACNIWAIRIETVELFLALVFIAWADEWLAIIRLIDILISACGTWATVVAALSALVNVNTDLGSVDIIIMITEAVAPLADTLEAAVSVAALTIWILAIVSTVGALVIVNARTINQGTDRVISRPASVAWACERTLIIVTWGINVTWWHIAWSTAITLVNIIAHVIVSIQRPSVIAATLVLAFGGGLINTCLIAWIGYLVILTLVDIDTIIADQASAVGWAWACVRASFIVTMGVDTGAWAYSQWALVNVDTGVTGWVIQVLLIAGLAFAWMSFAGNVEELVGAILGIVRNAKSSTLIIVNTALSSQSRMRWAFARPAGCSVNTILILIVAGGSGETIITALIALVDVFTCNWKVSGILGGFGLFVAVCAGTVVGTGMISADGVFVGAFVHVTVAFVDVLTNTTIHQVASVTLTVMCCFSDSVVIVDTVGVCLTRWRVIGVTLIDVVTRAQVTDTAQGGARNALALVARIVVFTWLNQRCVSSKSNMLALVEDDCVCALIDVGAHIRTVSFIHLLVAVNAVAFVTAVRILTSSTSTRR
jgi:hypothetical protein